MHEVHLREGATKSRRVQVLHWKYDKGRACAWACDWVREAFL